MAIDFKQEVLDWYNTNDKGETAEYFDEIWEDFLYTVPTKKEGEKGAVTPTLASGPVYIVEDFGGEGQGDDRYVVFSIADTFFKVEGYYSSWDGQTWDNPAPFEVEPEEITVIQYNRKK
jgi:hypothetical protein